LGGQIKEYEIHEIGMRVGEMRNAYEIFVGKSDTSCHLGDLGVHDNIKMEIKERVCEDVDWIQLAHGRVQWWHHVNTVWIFGFSKRREIS
jgi:hypothetical protein